MAMNASKSKTLPSKKANVSQTKAKQILSDGEVRDTPLTTAQRGLFGAIAGGAPTTKPRKPPTAIGQRPIPPRTQARMSAAASGGRMPPRRR